MSSQFQRAIQNSRLPALYSSRSFTEWSKEKLSFPILQIEGLSLDYSRQLCSSEAFQGLLRLAEERDLAGSIQQFQKRQQPWDLAGHADARDLQNPTTQKNLQEMETVLNQLVRDGITDIVNIGIGGSFLGPLMAEAALYHEARGPRCHFVANLDAASIQATTRHLNPNTTLVIAVSKTFTTEEMTTNFKAARQWLEKGVPAGELFSKHLLAITAFPERAMVLGFPKDRILSMPKNVGGRYSVWSSVGFCFAAAVGMKQFKEFLAGAAVMDAHFVSAPLSENMPVILALLGIWYQNFFGAQTQAVVPYAEPLRFLPDYLQQLCMESLGKSVTLEGKPVDYDTGSVVWGGAGTNTQHAIQQLILQGTHLIPTDFIIIKKRADISHENTARLITYATAQAEALTVGLSEANAAAHLRATAHSDEFSETEAPHRAVTRRQPVNLIQLETLCAKTLGLLVALYEYKVLVQAMTWNINPFDQWGVELGKMIAKRDDKPTP